MKTTLLLLISVTAVFALAYGQNSPKEENAQCQQNDECRQNLQCVSGRCSCQMGKKPQFESHAQGSHSEGVYVCQEVVGLGCEGENDCSQYLENSKCDENTKKCVCREEDNCINGAMTLTVLSVSVVMAMMAGIITMW